MGIESDQVVYEYLSRVGDVAQQRQLSSATRMRLVSELRNEIERRRAKAPVDSPAAVRRIIDRLGSPDDLVSAAAEGGGAPQTPTASVPVQRDRGAQPKPPGQQKQPKQQKQQKHPEPAGHPEQPGRTRRADGPDRPERPKGIRRIVPRPRTGAAPPADVPSDAASPPHRAPAHELGDGGAAPDWWLHEPTPFGPGEDIPGFVGGVEIPDLLKPPPRPKPEGEDDADDADDAESDAVEESAAPDDGASVTPARRRRLRLSRAAGAPARRWANPLLLIAAGCLVAGAALGNWFVLILGWLIAYASRRLSERETKAAVFWLPGLALTAGLVWLWGRSEGRWGAPVAEGHMSDAIADTWPWVIRGAAVASALFLAWRSQRQR
ncbi:hypothetical protein PYK79_41775 [Streptomyces sp. ID05-04B]|uniref:hypothetical protein n=1 Tax=unclassified Streptomyces TaxID=2593676 RepID=UPI000D19E1DD|nr:MULTISPECIES: hypothetical protein [unclassified Streptomyces]AVV42002.1 hypothetical protein C6376_11775 [Streptomyces sp. P3]MDX5568533.1 hypothetical protein [Streptomyces sp. ID05-04B]